MFCQYKGVLISIDLYPVNMIFGVVEVLDEMHNVNDFDYCCGSVMAHKNQNWRALERTQIGEDPVPFSIGL